MSSWQIWHKNEENSLYSNSFEKDVVYLSDKCEMNFVRFITGSYGKDIGVTEISLWVNCDRTLGFHCMAFMSFKYVLEVLRGVSVFYSLSLPFLISFSFCFSHLVLKCRRIWSKVERISVLLAQIVPIFKRILLLPEKAHGTLTKGGKTDGGDKSAFNGD